MGVSYDTVDVSHDFYVASDRNSVLLQKVTVIKEPIT